MTTNKKNSQLLVVVLALFVALSSNVHAQTTTQPAKPATPTSTIPTINPEKLVRLMFGPRIQVPQSPSPEALEGFYHAIWERIGTRYYDADALVALDWGKWEHAYDGKLATEADLDQALKAMLNSLSDPWTKYSSPTEMKENSRKKHEGIVSLGVSTRVNADSTIAISFLDFGSPAYTSALRVGDVLKAVDGKPLTGMTAQSVDELMTGKVGNEMAITYVRDSADATIKIVLAKHFEGTSQAIVLPGKSST